MCLGIPGRIVEIADTDKMLGIADVSGVRRAVNLACVAPPEGKLDVLIGDWVLIHVGFAMSRIDAEEAKATLDALALLGEAEEEIEAMRDSAQMLEATR